MLRIINLFYFVFCFHIFSFSDVLLDLDSCQNDQFKILRPTSNETLYYDHLLNYEGLEPIINNIIRYSVYMSSCSHPITFCVKLTSIDKPNIEKENCLDTQANSYGDIYGRFEGIFPGNFILQFYTLKLSNNNQTERQINNLQIIPIIIKRNVTVYQAYKESSTYIKHYVDEVDTLAYTVKVGRIVDRHISNILPDKNVIYMDIYPWEIHIGSFCSIAPDMKFLLSCKGGTHREDFVTTSPLWRLREKTKIDNYKYDTNPFYGNGSGCNRVVTVGNDVWIGQGVKIINSVTIGHGAILGAYAVVRKDVPPYAIIIGNPAQIIRYRFNESVIQKLLDIAWWDRFTFHEILFEMPYTNDLESFFKYAYSKMSTQL